MTQQPITLQQIFDTAMLGVINQGGKASYAGKCSYRSVNPETGTVRKCAVGHLIPDSAYDPESEGTTVVGVHAEDGKWVGGFAVGKTALNQEVAIADMLNKAGIPANDVVHDLMHRMQRLHDTNTAENFCDVADSALGIDLRNCYIGHIEGIASDFQLSSEAVLEALDKAWPAAELQPA